PRRAARPRPDPSMVIYGKASDVPPWTSGDGRSGNLTLTGYHRPRAARTAASTQGVGSGASGLATRPWHRYLPSRCIKGQNGRPGGLLLGEAVMQFDVAPVSLEEVLPLRELYRREMSCQIVHDSLPARGFGDLFLIRAAGKVAGYGFVMGYRG